MTDRRLLILGWTLAGILSTPWLIAAYDRALAEWERRHRPLWPPEGT